MFARTLAFGALALLIAVPAAAALPDVECMLPGYSTTPFTGPLDKVEQLNQQIEGCMYRTHSTELPQADIQFVPDLGALFQPNLDPIPEPQPLPGKVKASTYCKLDLECRTLGEPSIQGEAVSPVPEVGQLVELPTNCAQVYPWSAICDLPFGPVKVVVWLLQG